MANILGIEVNADILDVVATTVSKPIAPNSEITWAMLIGVVVLLALLAKAVENRGGN
jgi:hypothetical protein